MYLLYTLRAGLWEGLCCDRLFGDEQSGNDFPHVVRGGDAFGLCLGIDTRVVGEDIEDAFVASFQNRGKAQCRVEMLRQDRGALGIAQSETAVDDADEWESRHVSRENIRCP